MSATQRKNPYPNISAKWMYISVSRARELTDAIEHNRKLSPALVARYARDMMMGNWGLSESSIVIDDTGNVINGQHRLAAVVMASRGCWFSVVHGVPREAIVDMDQGKKRSIPEALRLSGAFEGPMDNAVVSWAKFLMIYGVGPQPKTVPTHHEVAEFISDHYDALSRVRRLATTSVRGVTTAPVFAVVVQAWEAGESKTRIGQFVHTLLTGESQGKQDNAGVRLRNWLTTSELNMGGTGRVEIYQKARRALAAFVAGESISRLLPMKNDPWPMAAVAGVGSA